ncbi:MAG: hypothetical protein IJH68_12655 [Thermoguttaceae bacterium]|nr:hypothetical protein [Thermoguttaceae bacterium]
MRTSANIPFRAPLAALLFFLALCSPSAHGAVNGSGQWLATDFGAAPTDVGTPFEEAVDCTEAIQSALNAAKEAGGGVVLLPAGRFTVKGTLSIPGGVTLEGTYRSAVTPGIFDQDVDGTTLLAYAGKNDPDSAPFISLAGINSVIKGVVIIYPEWDRKVLPPVPYPPCIESHDTVNVGVLDCALLNPYEGIRFVRAARHLVRDVTGYPIWRGLFVDQCLDIGRIENVHFWPFGLTFRDDDPYCEWINLNGTAFEFARTDWHYVANTFCFGYGVGYKFSEYEHGGTNGNFLGLGADCCRRAVLVEQAQAQGLLITNGEFVGRLNRNSDSICVEIGEKCRGKVSLVNCSFWGPLEYCIQKRNPDAPLTASACHFINWDNVRRTGNPAIDIQAGSANIADCTFMESASPEVRVSDDVQTVLLSGNLANGGFMVEGISDANRDRVQVFGNEPFIRFESLEHYRIEIGAVADKQFTSGWCTRGKDDEGHPFRWSTDHSKLRLAVKPKCAYDLTFVCEVPPQALDNVEAPGLYRDGERIAPLAAGYNELRARLAPTDGDVIVLEVRCGGWVPDEKDRRTLGIKGILFEMKAVDSPTP